MVRIAVAIPTYRPHLPLLPALLKAISTQTRLPEMVVISASSCQATDVDEIQRTTWPFTLLVLTTEAVSNAAENRNRAAEAVKQSVDLISFFDADDHMHPRRIESIVRAFEQHSGLDVILHACDHSDWNLPWEELPENQVVLQDTLFLKLETLIDPRTYTEIRTHCVYFEDIGVGSTIQQNGHVTVRSHCLDQVKQDPTAYGYEDTLFITDLFKANYSIALLPYRLSNYVMR